MATAPGGHDRSPAGIVGGGLRSADLPPGGHREHGLRGEREDVEAAPSPCATLLPLGTRARPGRRAAPGGSKAGPWSPPFTSEAARPAARRSEAKRRASQRPQVDRVSRAISQVPVGMGKKNAPSPPTAEPSEGGRRLRPGEPEAPLYIVTPRPSAPESKVRSLAKGGAFGCQSGHPRVTSWPAPPQSWREAVLARSSPIPERQVGRGMPELPQWRAVPRFPLRAHGSTRRLLGRGDRQPGRFQEPRLAKRARGGPRGRDRGIARVGAPAEVGFGTVSAALEISLGVRSRRWTKTIQTFRTGSDCSPQSDTFRRSSPARRSSAAPPLPSTPATGAASTATTCSKSFRSGLAGLGRPGVGGWLGDRAGVAARAHPGPARRDPDRDPAAPANAVPLETELVEGLRVPTLAEDGADQGVAAGGAPHGAGLPRRRGAPRAARGGRSRGGTAPFGSHLPAAPGGVAARGARRAARPCVARKDLAEIELMGYRGLVAPWNSWSHVAERGRFWAPLVARLAMETRQTSWHSASSASDRPRFSSPKTSAHGPAAPPRRSATSAGESERRPRIARELVPTVTLKLPRAVGRSRST